MHDKGVRRFRPHGHILLHGLKLHSLLVQHLVCELYARGVLGIQALDDGDQLCNHSTDFVVLLVVIPVLYVVTPDDLHGSTASGVGNGSGGAGCVPSFLTRRMGRRSAPATPSGCSRSSIAESLLFAEASSHETSAVSWWYSYSLVICLVVLRLQMAARHVLMVVAKFSCLYKHYKGSARGKRASGLLTEQCCTGMDGGVSAWQKLSICTWYC